MGAFSIFASTLSSVNEIQIELKLNPFGTNSLKIAPIAKISAPDLFLAINAYSCQSSMQAHPVFQSEKTTYYYMKKGNIIKPIVWSDIGASSLNFDSYITNVIPETIAQANLPFSSTSLLVKRKRKARTNQKLQNENTNDFAYFIQKDCLQRILSDHFSNFCYSKKISLYCPALAISLTFLAIFIIPFIQSFVKIIAGNVLQDSINEFIIFGGGFILSAVSSLIIYLVMKCKRRKTPVIVFADILDEAIVEIRKNSVISNNNNYSKIYQTISGL